MLKTDAVGLNFDTVRPSMVYIIPRSRLVCPPPGGSFGKVSNLIRTRSNTVVEWHGRGMQNLALMKLLLNCASRRERDVVITYRALSHLL